MHSCTWPLCGENGKKACFYRELSCLCSSMYTCVAGSLHLLCGFEWRAHAPAFLRHESLQYTASNKSMWGGASVFSIALAQARVGVGASSWGSELSSFCNWCICSGAVFPHASLGARKQMGKGSWCCVCVYPLSLSA